MTDEIIPLTDDITSQHTTPTTGILPWKVLVVDDDAEVHEVTSFVLRDHRFFGRPSCFCMPTAANKRASDFLNTPTSP
ncbi:MAG: hypothetical protein R3F37_20740 [Candidatus Competibacteraceae bacterium]